MTAATYNVRVEFETRDDVDEQLLDALEAYHPAVSRSERGWVEAIVSLPAEDFVQAMQTTVAIAAKALAAPVRVVEIMPTEEFDARLGLEPLPELVSVSEAAALLGVSRQAVLQRIESGSLPARQVGKAWVIQRAALHPQTGPLDKGPDRAEELVRAVRTLPPGPAR